MKTILLALALFAGTQIVGAQGTAFTYQGRLNAGGAPANGSYDFTFELFNAGSAVAGPLTNSTAVSNGLFTVTLDFGGGMFDGNARWLEIAVRTNGASGFVTLTPRQPLTPAPYAILAGSATTAGSVPTSGIGAGTANISITGNAGTATSAAYAGSAAMAYTALTATTATNLIGNVADAQLSANIPRLNGTNNFTGTNVFPGVTIATNVYNVINGAFVGNGGGLTNLNVAQFANSVLTNGETGITLGGTFNGSGAGLANLNASQLTSGTIPLARLPGAVLTNGETGVTLGGTFNGNATTATTANNFSGSLSGDVTGTQGATVVSSLGGQTVANVASGASAANAATSANSASTIVKRDASGNFSAGSISLNTNLYLPTTTASAGIIYSGGNTLIHDYGSANFFAGVNAGNLAITGYGNNVGVGFNALHNDTTGCANTAIGAGALANNTSSSYNTACGISTLASNTGGNYNTANGTYALSNNTNGSDNTASGSSALSGNTSGSQNTATGELALPSNTSGWQNTADGYQALYYNTSGSNNTASGYEALHGNITGFNNIALGYQAGYSIAGNNNIDIGNVGASSDNGIIRIGTSGTHTNTLLTGNVGIGTTSPGEALEVDGYNVAMRLRNTGDAIGAFLGDTCSSLQLGLYNPTASANGVIPANTRLSLFGMSNNGQVGSISSVYGCPTFRNLLDDGNGNMGLGTTTPAYKLDVVGDINASGNIRIGGVIKVSSDRNVKENFTAINPRTVLEKVTALPITQWQYKAEADGSKHLGPMAQDFHSAFGLSGADDKHIATVDESGVALAAIQGLNQKVESENAALRAENAGLKARLEKLENLMSARNGGGQ